MHEIGQNMIERALSHVCMNYGKLNYETIDLKLKTRAVFFWQLNSPETSINSVSQPAGWITLGRFSELLGGLQDDLSNICTIILFFYGNDSKNKSARLLIDKTHAFGWREMHDGGVSFSHGQSHVQSLCDGCALFNFIYFCIIHLNILFNNRKMDTLLV